jgi:DNA-binding NarL/FixJ family response regulator
LSIRVVLADDHAVVLDGLQALLALEDDIEVVEVCDSGSSAVEAVARHRPDVVVLDHEMPDSTGVDALGRIRQSGMDVRVVLLAAYLDDRALVRAFAANVDGLVLKEDAGQVLLECLKSVAKGKRFIPPELSERALESLVRADPEDEPAPELTQREVEIMNEVAPGLSNKKIARRLGIKESTVKLHLNNIFRKVRVSSRVQLALYARGEVKR